MKKYTNTDQRLHQLSQIIAKVNRTYVQKKEDDSHTNLSFDPTSKRIFGRWVNTIKGPRIFALDLNEGAFTWLDDTLKQVHIISFLGKKSTEIEEIIEAHLKDFHLSTEGFSGALHFEITDYKFKNQPFEHIDNQLITEWSNYRQLANYACKDALTFLQQEGEIRIWPHHFDTGIYVQPNEKTGIGFGLAMEDSMVGAPYFYLAGYALDGAMIDFKNVPKLSHGGWETTGGWKGVVLSLTDLEGLKFEKQLAKIHQFIKESATWYLQR